MWWSFESNHKIKTPAFMNQEPGYFNQCKIFYCNWNPIKIKMRQIGRHFQGTEEITQYFYICSSVYDVQPKQKCTSPALTRLLFTFGFFCWAYGLFINIWTTIWASQNLFVSILHIYFVMLYDHTSMNYPPTK